MKRIIFHIGGAKCGSSSIQFSLCLNYEALRQAGVMVPDERLGLSKATLGEQIELFESLRTAPAPAELMRNLFRAIANHMDDHSLHTCIVSAENLINEGFYATICKAAKEFFDPTIILYIRRQDDWMMSAWQQWFLKQYPSFDEFLQARSSSFCDWGQLLQPWEDAFGCDCIKVRPFKRSLLLNGDVVSDFYNTAGLSITGLKPLPATRNQSFNEAIGELAHRNRDLFSSISDNHFFEVYARLLGSAAFRTGRKSMLLTLDQRLQILDRFGDSNTLLSAKYLDPDVAGDLFAAPSVEDVSDSDDITKLQIENGLLARAIFILGCNLSRLKPVFRSSSGMKTFCS